MDFQKWTRITLFNFFIVSVLGLLMRYKIAFEFPFFEQKHLQHAHSHFAFLGWVSQAIYLLLIYLLSEWKSDISLIKYKRILIINNLFSYLQLIAFTIYGYHISSILFLNVLILISIYFMYQYYIDTRKLKNEHIILRWIYIAFIFNIFSNIGTFSLAYLMIQKIFNHKLQLSSIYFYLHFQYNAWFLFTCTALFLHQFKQNFSRRSQDILFWTFTIGTIPNYLLSIMWIEFPMPIKLLLIVSTGTQFLAWLYLIRQFRWTDASKFYQLFLTLLNFAFLIKLVLQIGSTSEFLSHLAYSLRSIVIAYIHLALLVIISGFLLYKLHQKILKVESKILYLLFFFILLNELGLGIQGFSGVLQYHISYMNKILVLVSIGISCSALLLISPKTPKP